MTTFPFQPIGATVQAVLSTTGATLTLASIDATVATSLRLEMSGSGTGTFVLGGVASTAGTPMTATSVEVFGRGSETTLGVIATTGTPTLKATLGIGS